MDSLLQMFQKKVLEVWLFHLKKRWSGGSTIVWRNLIFSLIKNPMDSLLQMFQKKSFRSVIIPFKKNDGQEDQLLFGEI